MKKAILTYGALSGSIIVGSIILSMNLAEGSESAKFLEWIGYSIMIVAFSMIFMGIKRYRDKDLGGVIKFGTATRLGLGITLVASLIYVAAWEVNLSVTDYAFIEEYTQGVLAAKEAKGVAGEEMVAAVAEMEKLKVNYASPLYRMPMTFMEIFPVGLLITLLAAAVLRNSKFMAATT